MVSYPALRSSTQVCEPINPAPPVTRIDIAYPSKDCDEIYSDYMILYIFQKINGSVNNILQKGCVFFVKL